MGDGNADLGISKSEQYARANSMKTLLQSSVARAGPEKVSFDVVMKTWNILSKIMILLVIYGIVDNFYSWISYNFFRVHFERLSVYEVFCVFFLVCLLFCIQAV